MCKRSCSRVTAQPHTGTSHCCVRRRRVRVYCLPLPLTLDPLWYAGLTVGGWVGWCSAGDRGGGGGGLDEAQGLRRLVGARLMETTD